MKGGGPSAGLAAAYRCLGMTAWLEGDLVPARSSSEAAIAMHDPERDRDARIVLGPDTAIVATSYLAHVLWQLGDFARARDLITDASRRAEAYGHPPTQALAIQFEALFEAARSDFEAARPLAERLARLSAERQLALIAALAALVSSWSSAALEGAAAAAARLRSALAD